RGISVGHHAKFASRKRMRKGAAPVSILVRVLLIVLALLLFVVGLVTMITPIPFGIFLIIVSFTLLTIAVPGVVRFWRRRWRWLDRLLDRATPRLPKWLGRRLKRSDPDASAPATIPATPPRTAAMTPRNPNKPGDRAARARYILMR
ncbi:MAG: hypothetical protein AAGK25_02565, partial [Pseudomonadota bacterium]